ncbi:hypothetical protein E4H12_11420 [Candidatus Thorarchaeota archaeon]|nr:MAG: hypothetical protein E4H12_11420 [Candidatus Thorarchaeota archaeon]
MTPLKAPKGMRKWRTPDGTPIDIDANGFGLFKSRNIGAAIRAGFIDVYRYTSEGDRGAPDYNPTDKKST